MQKALGRILVLCLLLASRTGAPAQDEAVFDTTTKPERERKRPSVFHRPARPSAVEQLVYADSLRQAGKRRAARAQYDALVRTWPQSPQAAEAQLQYAILLGEERRYKRAFEEYQYLIDNFTGGFDYEAVLEKQFAIANHVRTARHAAVLGLPGFADPERAIPLFEKIVANAPNGERAPECQFHIGLIQETQKEYALAVKAYEAVQLSYPGSDFAAEAAFRRAYCLSLIADSQPRNEESGKQAVSALAAFLIDFPGNANREAASKRLDALKTRMAAMCFERAVFYDRFARKPEAAVIAYTDFLNKFPASDYRPKVEARLEALKKESGNEQK